MFAKSPVPRHKLEAFHDGELTPQERQQISQDIETNETVRALYEEVCLEQALLHKALDHKIQAAIEQVDWAQYSQKIVAQVAEMQHLSAPTAPSIATPVPHTALPQQAQETQRSHLVNPSVNPSVAQPVEETTSLWQAVQEFSSWLRRRPGLLLSCVATAGVLMIIALPYLDPGPAPVDDVVVEKMVSSKTAQVAVLQTQNDRGQQMTVIVVDEPTSNNKTKPKKRVRKKKSGKTP